jgi:hypothetical protein
MHVRRRFSAFLILQYMEATQVRQPFHRDVTAGVTKVDSWRMLACQEALPPATLNAFDRCRGYAVLTDRQGLDQDFSPPNLVVRSGWSCGSTIRG